MLSKADRWGGEDPDPAGVGVLPSGTPTTSDPGRSLGSASSTEKHASGGISSSLSMSSIFSWSSMKVEEEEGVPVKVYIEDWEEANTGTCKNKLVRGMLKVRQSSSLTGKKRLLLVPHTDPHVNEGEDTQEKLSPKKRGNITRFSSFSISSPSIQRAFTRSGSSLDSGEVELESMHHIQHIFQANDRVEAFDEDVEYYRKGKIKKRATDKDEGYENGKCKFMVKFEGSHDLGGVAIEQKFIRELFVEGDHIEAHNNNCDPPRLARGHVKQVIIKDEDRDKHRSYKVRFDTSWEKELGSGTWKKHTKKHTSIKEDEEEDVLNATEM